MRVLVALFALLATSVDPEPETFEDRNGHEAFKNPEIDEKYDQWERFLEIMFVIACRAKHSKDVEGEAKAVWESTEGHMDYDGYVAEMKTIQQDNIKDFKRSCGMIPAEGLPKCRMGCQTQHGDQMVARDACDTKCEKMYFTFENECHNKVATLGNVYEIELGKLNSYLSCAELHCPDYPVTDGDTCNVDDLDTCKQEMVTDMMKEATTDFCESLFTWIYEANAKDPRTGDPIVARFLQMSEAHSAPIRRLKFLSAM